MWKSKLNLETKKKRSRKPIRIAAALLATIIGAGIWILASKSEGLQLSYAAGGGTLSASGASIQLINTQSLQGMT